MSILNTKHKRKSAILTTFLLLLMLYVAFNFGLQFLDPPEEYGLAINFSNSETGSGKSVQKTKTQPQPEKVEEQNVKEVKKISQEIKEEKVITNDLAKDVPVVEKKKESKKELVKENLKEEKPKKPSKESQNVLNNLLNKNAVDGSSKGEGDNDKLGVKGKENGDPDANKYYGNSRVGTGGNYNLAGRKALSKPIKKPNCEEEGTVVVRIEVDKKGRVVKATPGVKGSTNTAPCLLNPAKEAALKTKWNADANAPEKQKGTIIYRFSLTK